MSFSWAEAWKEITHEIGLYTGSSLWLLILSSAAAVYLFIARKETRRRILYPLLVLVPVIVNPVLYHYVYRDMRFWRFFWVAPQSVLVALAFIDLTARFRKGWVKCLCLLALSGIVALCGSNIFLYGEYHPTENPYKISQRTIDICDRILADDPHPLCIFDTIVHYDARQYNGNIRQAWSKNGNGATGETKKIFKLMQEPVRDWKTIFRFAKENGYTHVTCSPKQGETISKIRKTASKYGYKVLSRVGKHVIFHRVEDRD